MDREAIPVRRMARIVLLFASSLHVSVPLPAQEQNEEHLALPGQKDMVGSGKKNQALPVEVL